MPSSNPDRNLRGAVLASVVTAWVVLGCSNEPSPDAAMGGALPNAGGGMVSRGGTAGGAQGGAAGSAQGGIAGSAGDGAAGSAHGGNAGSSAGAGALSASGGTAGSAGGSGEGGSGGKAAGGAAGTAGDTSGGAAGVSAGGSASGASGAGAAMSGGSAGAGGTDDGRIVLFDGSDLSEWQHTNGDDVRWQLVTDAAAMEVVPGTGNIVTKQKFGSMLLHVEYWTPAYPASVTGQSRGNSGIYVKRAYEFQVLDSFGQPPADDTCGAIYETSAPLVSACYGAETWNTYEIEFQDSVWNGNTKTSLAVAVSVHLNGQLVQENVQLTMDPTRAGTPDAPGPQPLLLQDHDENGRVRYRNIWVIPR